MQALVIEEGRLAYFPEHPRPVLETGEALLRIRLAGICGTDLELLRGYYDYHGIPGHEFVADVVEVADGADRSWIGRRVVGSINIGCGACDACRTAGSAHCLQRTVLGIKGHGGVFAEYATLPIANLVSVPDQLPDDHAVFCEPLAAAVRLRQQVRLDPTARIAVVGAGRLGLLVGQVLGLDGACVQMIGRSMASLALPRELGLGTALDAETASNAFDMVVEVTGNSAGLETALRLVRPQGTLVMKSTFAAPAEVDLTKIVVDEVRVQGSRCGPFAPALRLLLAGRIAVTPLIDSVFSLADGPEAFARAAMPGVRKVFLRPE